MFISTIYRIKLSIFERKIKKTCVCFVDKKDESR